LAIGGVAEKNENFLFASVGLEKQLGVLKAMDVLAIFTMAPYPLPTYCLVDIDGAQ